ncbi:hypothetical protein [Halomonas sp. I5-271120]|uniref:hypothetical protein n=1 Tax=Halomonas sp. I5-271120 TaxID=3061632 RepID=UPI002714C994|nr:hypothetical protein [Halomonas sp. I5-271120]
MASQHENMTQATTGLIAGGTSGMRGEAALAQDLLMLAIAHMPQDKLEQWGSSVLSEIEDGCSPIADALDADDAEDVVMAFRKAVNKEAA